jgi:hypothetical protein
LHGLSITEREEKGERRKEGEEVGAGASGLALAA